LLGAQGIAEAEAAAVAFKPVSVNPAAKPSTARKPKLARVISAISDDTVGGSRRSARLRGDGAPHVPDLPDEDSGDLRPVKRHSPARRDNTFGAIEGMMLTCMSTRLVVSPCCDTFCDHWFYQALLWAPRGSSVLTAARMAFIGPQLLAFTGRNPMVATPYACLEATKTTWTVVSLVTCRHCVCWTPRCWL
jgi:hypothetical protein